MPKISHFSPKSHLFGLRRAVTSHGMSLLTNLSLDRAQLISMIQPETSVVLKVSLTTAINDYGD